MRIEADAAVANVASQRRLLRAGFIEQGRSRRRIGPGGVWHDRVHVDRHAVSGTFAWQADYGFPPVRPTRKSRKRRVFAGMCRRDG